MLPREVGSSRGSVSPRKEAHNLIQQRGDAGGHMIWKSPRSPAQSNAFVHTATLPAPPSKLPSGYIQPEVGATDAFVRRHLHTYYPPGPGTGLGAADEADKIPGFRREGRTDRQERTMKHREKLLSPKKGSPVGAGGAALRKEEAATVGLQGRGSAQRGGVFQQFKVCSHGISFQDEEGQ